MSVALAHRPPVHHRHTPHGDTRVPVRPPLRVVGGAGGELLLPLGEVLVPAGRRPVLRLLAPGAAGPPAAPLRARTTAGAPLPPRPAGAAPARAGVRPATGPARRVRLRRARRLRAVVRLTLALALAAAALRGLVPGGGEASAAVPVSAAPAPRVVVVEPGETLWSLARELAPDADPRAVVERMRALNGLESAGLAVGQRLLVPAAG